VLREKACQSLQGNYDQQQQQQFSTSNSALNNARGLSSGKNIDQ